MRWKNAIGQAVKDQNPGMGVNIQFVMHDWLFDKVADVDWTDAFGQLLGSWIWHGLRGRAAARGIGDQLTLYRQYYAGMVAKWVSNAALRRDLRELVSATVKQHQPQLLIGHSLGSLICYDLLTTESAKPGENAAPLKGLTFMSVGSQIGHPSVRSVFGGRLTMPQVKRWFHIYNEADWVFTAPINVMEPGFQQVTIHQNVPQATNEHDAVGYFSDDESALVWKAIAAPAKTQARARSLLSKTSRKLATPSHRALLVGINKYSGDSPQLDGCVNDAYLMSAVLQEGGFQPEQIRLLLDERATASAIRDRIGWLLEDVKPGDIRVMHFSGHGAQIPSYGWKEEVDHFDECLCPHDFDWSPERSIVDKWFYETYSQLPYDCHFIGIFDCCHSGGITRGGVKVRGLMPPDDVRHRMLRWNPKTSLWEARKLPAASPAFARRAEFTGESGSVYKLGRAIPLRQVPAAKFTRATKTLGHKGPYMPVLFEACQESELAEEYQAGSQSFGVFTYALAKSLRKSRQDGKRLTFRQLFTKACREIKSLDYSQKPNLVGPTAVLKQGIPPSITG